MLEVTGIITHKNWSYGTVKSGNTEHIRYGTSLWHRDQIF